MKNKILRNFQRVRYKTILCIILRFQLVETWVIRQIVHGRSVVWRNLNAHHQFLKTTLAGIPLSNDKKKCSLLDDADDVLSD